MGIYGHLWASMGLREGIYGVTRAPMGIYGEILTPCTKRGVREGGSYPAKPGQGYEEA
jgi:hypothetical protein